jgi:hypothetical protein
MGRSGLGVRDAGCAKEATFACTTCCPCAGVPPTTHAEVIGPSAWAGADTSADIETGDPGRSGIPSSGEGWTIPRIGGLGDRKICINTGCGRALPCINMHTREAEVDRGTTGETTGADVQ